MRKEWIEIWRSLPKWIRRELIRGGRGGWIYSGMEEIGWSYADVVGIGFCEDIVSGAEGEIIIMGIPIWMEYLRGLVGGGEFRSWREGEAIYMEMIFGEEKFLSWGKDREEVFLNMLREVGEWYWQEHRPSFGNINYRDIMSPGEMIGGGGIKFDVEIRDGVEGLEVIFSDFWGAKMFMGRWNRFILEEGFSSSVCGGEYYHGRMLMVEGEVRVISTGGGAMPSDMGGVYSSRQYGYNVTGLNNYVDKVSSLYGGGGAIGIPMGGGNVEVILDELDDVIGVGRPN